MSKAKRLRELAKKRQRDRWDGFNCIGDYHAGAYECAHVSPYTISAKNYDADLFLLLQDWSSHSFLSKPVNRDVQRLGHAPTLPTNCNLLALLRAHFDRELSSVYATNLFPFVKPAGLSAEIPRALLVKAAEEYALPQVAIVRPKIVVCLGLATFNALRSACGLLGCESVAIAVGSEFTWKGAQVWAQAHPGYFGQIGRNTGGVDRVRSDWQRMKAALDARA